MPEAGYAKTTLSSTWAVKEVVLRWGRFQTLNSQQEKTLGGDKKMTKTEEKPLTVNVCCFPVLATAPREHRDEVWFWTHNVSTRLNKQLVV